MISAPAEQVRWLFLDLDSYFASCEQQARPDLRGKPVGIVPMMAETTCCLAASREAKRQGVKTGTLVAEARVRCPEITLVVARHDLYTLYHKIVVEAVGTCLPIDSILSIDEMICELTGSQRELPKAVALADQIKTILRQRVGDTLTCSIGLAPNRFLAKVASDMNKPNGLTIIRTSDLPQMLYPLRLQDFPGIGPRMGRRLEEHGISTVKELYGLSITKMADLWGGVLGERFYRWFRGEDVELAETVHRSLGHQHVLEPEFRTSQGAWMVAKKLLVKAAVRLRKEGYYARRLALNIHFMGGSYWGKDTKLEETQDTLVLLGALRRLWAILPEGTPFRVSVTFFDLIPKNRHQLSLLVNPARENLGEAMDRLNTKYGKGTVSVGGLLEQNQSGAPTRISFSRVPDLEEF
jgi:DNA polymerase-4